MEHYRHVRLRNDVVDRSEAAHIRFPLVRGPCASFRLRAMSSLRPLLQILTPRRGSVDLLRERKRARFGEHLARLRHARGCAEVTEVADPPLLCSLGDRSGPCRVLPLRLAISAREHEC